MADARFEQVTPHVDRFTADGRTDRPNLGAIHGSRATLLVDAGASPAHLAAFVGALDAHGRPPVEAIVLTHWHWDHSFGSGALDVPVVAHTETAHGLAIQAGYDWSDEALAGRVRDGLEIAFCADMIRLELPDRHDLRIVLPSETFADSWTIDLGGVVATALHVGGDHAADSCVVWVEQDSVLFFSDCLYQRLYADAPHLTIDGTRALVARMRRFVPAVALDGHGDDVLDTTAFTGWLDEMETAAHLVDRHGAEATAHANTDEIRDLVAFLLAAPRA